MGGIPHLRSGWGGTPSQVWTGEYPIPGLDGGYPIPGLDGGVGVPPARTGWSTTPPGLDGVSPTRTGWGTPLTRTGWGTLPLARNGWGTLSPPPLDRAAKRALAMQWEVCLLHSRRRTFLSNYIISSDSKY